MKPKERLSPKEANILKLKLAELIKNQFDNDGPTITHEELAHLLVRATGSITAKADVALYGGPAVAHLRRAMDYAIVPITANFPDFDPADEVELTIVNAVAGLGAGGPRVGWYHPSSKDDWLWVYYIGHLGNAGMAAVFHAANQVEDNPGLTSASGRRLMTGRMTKGLPEVTKPEAQMLEARIAGK